MSSKSARDTEYMLNTLQRAGIARADAEALRRISMTLHRWHELECGTGEGQTTYIIRPGDVPEGATVDSCYSRGLAVYK